jgi:hypothetical protein
MFCYKTLSDDYNISMFPLNALECNISPGCGLESSRDAAEPYSGENANILI